MIKLGLIFLPFFMTALAFGQDQFESDTFKTSSGDLKITFIGHGSVFFEFAGKVVHVDPWGKLADYSRLPKADVILVTHEHQDHFDKNAIESIRKPGTIVVLTAACAGGTVMKNGDARTLGGLKVEAVPAYNLVHKRPDGQVFHPKGSGNGYVLTFGDKRVYVAGDTENIPEMRTLKNIDIAFLPMNLPYTMTPQMAASAAGMINPRILYPYHYGETETGKLVELMRNFKSTEVRIRKMK